VEIDMSFIRRDLFPRNLLLDASRKGSYLESLVTLDNVIDIVSELTGVSIATQTERVVKQGVRLTMSWSSFTNLDERREALLVTALFRWVLDLLTDVRTTELVGSKAAAQAFIRQVMAGSAIIRELRSSLSI
jgi:hypothetical protein